MPAEMAEKQEQQGGAETRENVDMEKGAAATVQEQESSERKEREQDAAADARPKVKASDVEVNAADATLNVLSSSNGRFVMTLTDGGAQYLLAGARATHGVKSGRYMFEIKVVESLTPVDQGRGRNQQ